MGEVQKGWQGRIGRQLTSLPNITTQKNILENQPKLKPLYTENIQNGLFENKKYKRYTRLSNIMLTLVGLKALMCFICFQLELKQSQFTGIFLTISFFVHSITFILKCLIERTRYCMLKPTNKYKYALGWSVLKVLIMGILYPQPWLANIHFATRFADHKNNQFQYPYRINNILILLAICIAGIQITLGLFLKSIYHSPRAKRICLIFELTHQQLYAFKCLFKDIPTALFGLFLFSIWIFFTFAIRVAEAGVPVKPNHFLHYENCFWYSGVTAFATGFGDISVRSDMGRLVTFMCSLWGAFNVSITVVLLVNTLSLNQSQKKSITLMNRINNTVDKKQLCGKYIRHAVWRLWLNKKYSLKCKQSLSQRKLKRNLTSMRAQEKRCNITEELGTFMQRQFDRTLIDLQMLVDNNSKVLSHVGKDMFLKTNQVSSQEETKLNFMFRQQKAVRNRSKFKTNDPLKCTKRDSEYEWKQQVIILSQKVNRKLQYVPLGLESPAERSP